MTSTTLDDIWDVPAESFSHNQPTNDVSEPLFLDDDNEEEQRRADDAATRVRIAEEGHKEGRVPDAVDAVFANLDGIDDDVTPVRKLKLDDISRAAAAKYQIPSKTTTTTTTSTTTGPLVLDIDDNGQGSKKEGGDDDPKKERKRPPKLDERLLLSQDGIPNLIKATRDFRVRGKGNEHSDLKRLLQVYQFWAHRMYPKTQFKDTIQKVEKLCHSKRMTVALSVWRDEEHGVSIQSDAQSDKEEGKQQQTNEPAPSSSPASSVSAIDTDGLFLNKNPDHDVTMPPAASLPQSVTGNDSDDDMYWDGPDDVDLEMLQSENPTSTTSGVPLAIGGAEADDEEMLQLAMEMIPDMPT